MRILLDTNVLVWFTRTPERIGPKTRIFIEKSSDRYISSISSLEIVIKVMNRKLQFPGRIDEAVAALGGEYLSFSARHAEAVREFPDLARHDPFDRMLLAQAQTEGLRFLTSDKALLKLGLPYIVNALE